MTECSVAGGNIDTAIVEESIVDGLKIAGLFLIFGAVFKHVTLIGKIDRLMIANDVMPSLLLHEDYRSQEVLSFRHANAEYYRNVDWALDISHGQFRELEIRGIPSRLIRRDPETQVVVTRQKALTGEWRDLPFVNRVAAFSLDYMLRQEWQDTVLIAPKRHRKFALYLQDLNLLREAGIAEPD
jgi:hypothetical protein